MSKKGSSPEDKFYDTVKGASGIITLGNGSTMCGILCWVDTYSLGVEVEYEKLSGGTARKATRLVMKGELATLELVAGEV